ncbi:hypothetical protein O181_103711, partial [Austropuccinia psidii MF-1]|nr:hypothetical protein [Austropuccinia psidii MF-1]
CLARKPRGNPPQARVAPDGQRNSSAPEPEVATTQSTEEPFGKSPLLFLHSYQLFLTFSLTISSSSATPCSIIIIDDTPVGSPPVQSPSHSHNDACQEFTKLQPTLMIPQAIVHESINGILLEHCPLLHMIPFVDVTHRNEMHREFREELNPSLARHWRLIQRRTSPG